MALALFILANVFLAAHTSESGLGESSQPGRRVIRSGNTRLAPGNEARRVPSVRSEVLEEADSESAQLVTGGSVSLSRPVQQAGGGNTCQRIDADAGSGTYMGGNGIDPREDFEAIDDSDIPGWGPGCQYGSGNCPTNRPLTSKEEKRYYSELDWVMSEHVPGRT